MAKGIGFAEEMVWKLSTPLRTVSVIVNYVLDGVADPTTIYNVCWLTK